MGRTKALPPRAKPMKQERARTIITSDRRITGQALQRLRLEMWSQDPWCKGCGRITAYPYGFNIDHIVPLEQGGEDAEHNRQLLCIECHDLKTKHEAKQRKF